MCPRTHRDHIWSWGNPRLCVPVKSSSGRSAEQWAHVHHELVQDRPGAGPLAMGPCVCAGATIALHLGLLLCSHNAMGHLLLWAPRPQWVLLLLFPVLGISLS